MTYIYIQLVSNIIVEFHTFVSSSSTCTNAFYMISKKSCSI